MAISLNLEKIEKLNAENQAYIAGVVDALLATVETQQEQPDDAAPSDKPR